jgi:hypothetical protein
MLSRIPVFPRCRRSPFTPGEAIAVTYGGLASAPLLALAIWWICVTPGVLEFLGWTIFIIAFVLLIPVIVPVGVIYLAFQIVSWLGTLDF